MQSRYVVKSGEHAGTRVAVIAKAGKEMLVQSEDKQRFKIPFSELRPLFDEFSHPVEAPRYGHTWAYHDNSKAEGNS